MPLSNPWCFVARFCEIVDRSQSGLESRRGPSLRKQKRQAILTRWVPRCMELSEKDMSSAPKGVESSPPVKRRTRRGTRGGRSGVRSARLENRAARCPQQTVPRAVPKRWENAPKGLIPLQLLKKAILRLYGRGQISRLESIRAAQEIARRYNLSSGGALIRIANASQQAHLSESFVRESDIVKEMILVEIARIRERGANVNCPDSYSRLVQNIMLPPPNLRRRGAVRGRGGQPLPGNRSGTIDFARSASSRGHPDARGSPRDPLRSRRGRW
jgi:hypothetical protein